MRVTEEAETCHYGCAHTASSAASWAWQLRPDRGDENEKGVVARTGTSSGALARAGCTQ